MLCRRHFTLIELLAVMAIIAILAAILIGGMNYAAKRADTAKTEAVIAQMEMALEAFKTDNGYYPISIDREIKFKVDGTGVLMMAVESEYTFKGGNGRPYLELGQVTTTAEAMPLDAWGNGLRYQCPGTNNPQKFDVWSYGANGIAGGDDDIGNWKK